MNDTEAMRLCGIIKKPDEVVPILKSYLQPENYLNAIRNLFSSPGAAGDL